MAKGIVRFNEQIVSKIPGVKVIRGGAKTEAEALAFLSESDNIFGHHIRGGAAMGPASDPLAVVDSNQKVYGTENVYVAGTAAWNGSLGPFPIVPIEAMSARLADKMLDANKRPR
jgi:choline dehydrogenase-like flavoprotein